MSRFALQVVLLAAVYLAVLASTDPVDALTGAALAVLVLLAAGRRPRGGPAAPPSLARRLLALPLFAAGVLVDTARGTWDVALVILGTRAPRAAGIVEIPIGDRSPTGIVAFAVANTLTPGELLVDIDRERGVMLLHVLDAADPDAVRRRHERGWERQRRVFP